MWYRKRPVKISDLEEFQEGKEYNSSELEAFATAMLKKDRRDTGEDHNILFDEQIYNKSKREILVDAFDIDGTLTNIMQDKDKPGVYKGDGQKMYNRAHPLGRKVNDETARKTKGASYYRN